MTRTMAAVFAGALLGGLARFELTQHWPPNSGGFPWSTFTVNTLGSFLLAVLVVASERRLAHLPYVRPALGTGFCGSFMTFGSVVTSADLFAAHAHPALAGAYLFGSLGAGLLAVFAGFVVTRAVLNVRSVPAVEAVS